MLGGAPVRPRLWLALFQGSGAPCWSGRGLHGRSPLWAWRALLQRWCGAPFPRDPFSSVTPNNVPIPAVEPGVHSFAKTCAATSPSGASAVVLREPGRGSASGVGALPGNRRPTRVSGQLIGYMGQMRGSHLSFT